MLTVSSNAADRHQIGLGDDSNGLFIGYVWDSGAPAFAFIHRNDGTDTTILQTAWDKSDPFGSGNTFDPTLGNVYRIQFAWLGFGPLVLSILSPITGEFVKVHTIQYPNTTTVVSMRIPSLPIRVECTRGGTSTDMTIGVPSIAGSIEGKDRLLGRSFGAASTTEHSANLSKDSNVVLLGVRNESTLESPFGGAASKVSNSLRVRLKQLSVALRGSGADKMAVVHLYRNLDFGASALSGWTKPDPSSACYVQSFHSSVVGANTGSVSGTIASRTATSVTLDASDLSNMHSSLATSWIMNVPFVADTAESGMTWPVKTKTDDTAVTVPRMSTLPDVGSSVTFFNGVCILTAVMSEGAVSLNLTDENLFLNPGETVTVVIRPTTANIRAIAALTWNEYS